MPDPDLEHYPNKDNVWGYDTITPLIQERVGTMPDLPRRVAIHVSRTESDDQSIHAQFDRFDAGYEVLKLEWLDQPFHLFFFAFSDVFATARGVSQVLLQKQTQASAISARADRASSSRHRAS